MTFIAEIYSQPDVIQATIDAARPQLTAIQSLLDRARSGEFHQIIFSGMGSSFSVVYPTILRLIECDLCIHAVEASELIHYQSNLIHDDSLVIFISQSGNSAEVPGLLKTAHERGAPVLAITNTPDSPLHRGATETLFIHAGAEATVSSKTYTCSLAMLHLLATALLEEDMQQAAADLNALVSHIREQLSEWHQSARTLAEQWRNTGAIEYLGRGYSTASALTAALISKESMKLPTEALNAGQFRHGPIELVDRDFTGVLFAGDRKSRQLNAELGQDIARLGGHLAVISETDLEVPDTVWLRVPECTPALLPLTEIVPVQLLCAELSAKRGFEPGHFRYIGKVTSHE